MTGWEPKQAILSEGRHAFLEFVKLCQKYQLEATAVNSVIQTLAHENLALAERLMEIKQSLQADLSDLVAAEYRPLCAALLHGNDVLPVLQEFLKHHQ
jgi:hypothetical protein